MQKLLLFSLLLSMVPLGGPLCAQTTSPGHAAVAAGPTNPILPGDHPDPSIIRVGNTYWTTSTSGDWAPEFPLFRSTDLHHWTAAGAVFPETPEWATESFWAPELVADHGRVLVYYVARKRGGPLCVAVATASRASGPYTDHGPIVCQPDGSIDPSFVRDEHGKPFLIWKEDGNSEGKLTPIWAQPLADDLVKVTGTKTQLLVNEPASWEGGVVEGPYIFRHADRFYLFYAGNACCGVACHYAEGVARADHLFGPWEKDPANPIIPPNAAWKCPGHGTAVKTASGKDYLLYHAYPTVGTIHLGRESVLDEITWTPDGWPVINGGHGPSGGVSDAVGATQGAFVDDFQTTVLAPGWKWPIARVPVVHVGGGQLKLEAAADEAPVFLGRSLLSAAYSVTVGVAATGGAEAGLSIMGNAKKQFLFTRRGTHLELSHFAEGPRQVLWQADVPTDAVVRLRAASTGPEGVAFSYSLDGKQWIAAGADVSLNGLPQWDEGLRIGLMCIGAPGTRGVFSHFALSHAKD